LRVYDSHFDGPCVLDNGGGVSAESVIYLVRCTARGGTNQIRINGTGSVFLIDSDIEASTLHAILFQQAGKLTIIGGSLRTLDATGNAIEVAGGSGGSIILAGTKADLSKINDSLGVVNHIGSREALLATERVKLAGTQPDYAPLLASNYVAPDNSAIAAAKTVTDKLNTALEDNAGSYRFTEAALELAPAGGGGGGGLTTDQDTKLTAIYQKTALITAGKTTIVSPLGPSGLITLIQGFDWPVSDNAGINVEEPYVGAWPAYIATASQHILFAVKKDGTEEFTGTGEVLAPLGDGRRRLGYSINKSELTDWPGKYEYYLGCVLSSGNRVAFSSGELTLKRGPSV
jgi:hypothetical protein